MNEACNIYKTATYHFRHREKLSVSIDNSSSRWWWSYNPLVSYRVCCKCQPANFVPPVWWHHVEFILDGRMFSNGRCNWNKIHDKLCCSTSSCIMVHLKICQNFYECFLLMTTASNSWCPESLFWMLLNSSTIRWSAKIWLRGVWLSGISDSDMWTHLPNNMIMYNAPTRLYHWVKGPTHVQHTLQVS